MTATKGDDTTKMVKMYGGMSREKKLTAAHQGGRKLKHERGDRCKEGCYISILCEEQFR